MSISIDFTHPIPITLSGKTLDYYSYNRYVINSPSSDYRINTAGSRALNNENLSIYTEYYNNVSYVYVRGEADYSQVKVLLPCIYYIDGHACNFDREITLY